MVKHWSKVEYLHQTVKNPNIIIKGTKSYYSNAYTKNFEDYVVRYLWGDSYSKKIFPHYGNMTSFISAIMFVSALKPLS